MDLKEEAAPRGGRAGSPQPPAFALFLAEPGRMAWEYASFPLAAPWLRLAPKGHGHGVFVLPGLLADDVSTLLLRRFLHRLGYQAWGWRLGRNYGPSADVLAGMPRALATLAERTGGPVSVIGWSLGGIYARELAREHPDLVRQVITLGSPFNLVDSRQSRAHRTFQRQSHRHVSTSVRRPREQLRRPVPVPSTAVYSRTDGIVHWSSCIEPPGVRHENVRVRCSHLGFGVDPATYWVIADRLAQPVERWSRFVPPPWLRILYPGSSR
jgi:pimeloyl-ACP methyl ester carboxylesterase